MKEIKYIRNGWLTVRRNEEEEKKPNKFYSPQLQTVPANMQKMFF
jgi:hypothetical protein